MRIAISILWPSFLTAIAAEGLFFSLFDPRELALAGSHIDMSVTAVYTLGFFCFWLFCSLASSLTCYLLQVEE
ncbi:hypothetical protein ACO0LO_14045 [Undibacterium sp. TJN25]|uniref:hypothetical protein n=1 Tax=Undibacterium sp. TJN25 TaxID=3413056 RepID=UPI003BF33300